MLTAENDNKYMKNSTAPPAMNREATEPIQIDVQFMHDIKSNKPPFLFCFRAR